MADVSANQSTARRGSLPRINSRAVVMTLYLLFLLLPIYWLLNMSLKTNTEILNELHALAERPDIRELRDDPDRCQRGTWDMSTR